MVSRVLLRFSAYYRVMALADNMTEALAQQVAVYLIHHLLDIDAGSGHPPRLEHVFPCLQDAAGIIPADLLARSGLMG